MDLKKLVENIKKYCKLKGVDITPACRESGVGHNFYQNLKNGKKPSVEKVQMLAAYLGVTTSELLGEKIPAGGKASGQNEEGGTIPGFLDLSPERRELVRQHVALLLAEQQNG